VRHVLQEFSGDGHCAAYWDTLVQEASTLLQIDQPIIEQAILAEIEAENLVQEEQDGKPVLFLTPLQRAEQGIASSIKRLLDGHPPWVDIQPDKTIPWVEQKTGLELSLSQQQAVRLALTSKVLVITGGPGVGKTTLVNSILLILRAKALNVTLCAPTGRAAKRLSESTGLEAKTIHRLLEFDPQSFGFKRNKDNPLETELLVIDESSMVDVALMNRLLSAVPDKAGLLIVGDVDQLPSVGPGSVLADIIDSGAVPTVRLTEIFRQAATSKIITNAHRINKGQQPLNAEGKELSDFYFIPGDTPEDIHAKLIQVVTERIPKRFNLDPIRDIQVLTPMNRGGLGSHSLNTELQAKLNGSAEPKVTRFGVTFSPGDKVIQTVNNYDKEVFNGDIGRIREIDTEESTLLIDQGFICDICIKWFHIKS